MQEEITPEFGFANTLLELNGGETSKLLASHLRQLVAAVKETGKKGSLTFKIELGQEKRTVGAVIVIDEKIDVKLPQHDRPSTVFFTDEEDNLLRDNPRQIQMFPERDKVQ